MLDTRRCPCVSSTACFLGPIGVQHWAVVPRSRRAHNGALAQLGEHSLCKREVVGSSPTGSTTLRRSPCGDRPSFRKRRAVRGRFAAGLPGFGMNRTGSGRSRTPGSTRSSFPSVMGRDDGAVGTDLGPRCRGVVRRMGGALPHSCMRNGCDRLMAFISGRVPCHMRSTGFRLPAPPLEEVLLPVPMACRSALRRHRSLQSSRPAVPSWRPHRTRAEVRS